MFRKIWIATLAALALTHASVAAQDVEDGWSEAAGVNLSLEEGYGARHSGMAITFGGFQRDANAVANAPAAMNDVDDFTFSTAHAEKFGEAKFDDFAFLVPVEARSTLGLGISRYGVSGIERRREDVSALSSQPQGLFSIADYLVVAGFSRRWGRTAAGTLDVGANFNFLYRQLDQDGFGMRADGMAQYTWNDRLRFGALVKGLIPSTATWESGYQEYEAPDLYLAFAFRSPAPYFYGTLQAAYQTEGLIQERAKAQGEDFGSRFFSDPGKTLLAGNLGLEFLFDFGLVVRAGLAELGLGGGTLSSSAFGIGYTWKKMLGLDYSFAPHPDLDASHRIALQFTPAFPKFNGRNFRTGGREPEAPIRKPEDSDSPETAPDETLEGGSELQESPADQPPAHPAPEGAAPASPAPGPAKLVAPPPAAPPAPQPETKSAAPTQAPAPMPGQKAPQEQLEEEIEEGE